MNKPLNYIELNFLSYTEQAQELKKLELPYDDYLDYRLNYVNTNNITSIQPKQEEGCIIYLVGGSVETKECLEEVLELINEANEKMRLAIKQD